MDLSETTSAEAKYYLWENIQGEQVIHKNFRYSDLSNHRRFIQKDKRKHFHPKQTR
jgi:hypothetical protein